MKKVYSWALIVTCCALAWASAFAQENTNEAIQREATELSSPPPRGFYRQNGFSMRRNAMSGQQEQNLYPRGGAATDKWLESLKSANPPEYERLIALRKENPVSFQEELRSRLRMERVRVELRDHPNVSQAIEDLPPEDRDWIMHRLQPTPNPNRVGGGGGMGPGGGMQKGGKGGMTKSDPAIDQAQAEVMEMVPAYRSAQTEEERNQLREEIRAKLSEVFDLRVARQTSDLDAEVKKITETIEYRKTNRDQIIEQRLQQLIDNKSLSW